MKKLYCAVYRTGGESNFKWNRSLAMTHEEAIATVADIKTGGRAAYLVDYQQSLAVGLPETYSASDRIDMIDENDDGQRLCGGCRITREDFDNPNAFCRHLR